MFKTNTRVDFSLKKLFVCEEKRGTIALSSPDKIPAVMVFTQAEEVITEGRREVFLVEGHSFLLTRICCEALFVLANIEINKIIVYYQPSSAAVSPFMVLLRVAESYKALVITGSTPT